ncbi:uroporphyrinogen-III C-methyltransferase, partial [bacterium]|nr:uroporphyrinogen-III C-methyltransferase [bacterium]
SRFIQGRLIMHGADPDTPMSIIENVSQYNQRIFSTTLSQLTKCITQNKIIGPALSLYGLAPREVSNIAEIIDHSSEVRNEKEFA